MTVDNLRVYKPTNPSFLDWMRFTVKINGVLTNCVANFQKGHIYVHWHAGGHRLLLMDDFQKMHGDITDFMRTNLEKSKKYYCYLPTETCRWTRA